MKTIRIAFAGTGYIQHYHARGLQAAEGVELTAVLSGHPENARKFAQEYNIPKVYEDISEMSHDPDINAVVISTPNAFHAPYALELLNQGKDVFLEKPMAMNVAESLEIKQAAERNDRLVMVGHMWRFDEDVLYLKESIDAGKLGKIYKTKGYGIHENWGPSGWFTRRELAGGGALADMGVHAIDTARFLLGDPSPVKVYARIATHFGDYDVDDTGTILVSWDNGADSIFESGWWQPHMDGPEAASGLYGTKGYASLFPTFLKLTKGPEESEKIVPELAPREEHCDQKIYDAQMEDFVACIRERRNPVPGIEEGLAVMQIVDAAYQSAASGEVVNIGSEDS